MAARESCELEPSVWSFPDWSWAGCQYRLSVIQSLTCGLQIGRESSLDPRSRQAPRQAESGRTCLLDNQNGARNPDTHSVIPASLAARL